MQKMRSDSSEETTLPCKNLEREWAVDIASDAGVGRGVLLY